MDETQSREPVRAKMVSVKSKLKLEKGHNLTVGLIFDSTLSVAM